MMKLTNLLEEFHGTQAEYLDIINYEIARENICGYIFLLSRISQNAEPTERMGHNPKTGEKLKIEAKEIVTFKQGKALGEQFIAKPKQKSKAKKKA